MAKPDRVPLIAIHNDSPFKLNRRLPWVKFDFYFLSSISVRQRVVFVPLLESDEIRATRMQVLINQTGVTEFRIKILGIDKKRYITGKMPVE